MKKGKKEERNNIINMKQEINEDIKKEINKKRN